MSKIASSLIDMLSLLCYNIYIMGVIYTSSEVSQALVPTDGAHIDAAQRVIESVPGLDGSVLTVVHGSVPDGRANIRSDLDVLITYRYEDPNAEPLIVDRIKATLDRIAADTNVKIEPNIWPADEPTVARRERMYDLLFAHHLSEAMHHPVWSVGDPDAKLTEITAMTLDEASIRKIMFNYLTYKHSGITKAPREFDDTNNSALLGFQRVLEFPKAFGRKAMQLTSSLYPDAADNYPSAFDHPDVSEELSKVIVELRKTDAEYTKLLVSMSDNFGNLRGKEVSDYNKWLGDRYPKVLGLGMVATSGFTQFLHTHYEQQFTII